MNMKEFLQKQGIEEEKAQSVVDGMKENKMYITSEENLDERYNKLKTQKEDLETQITTKDDLINDMKTSTKSNDDMQTKISDYEGQIQTLQNQSQLQQKENAVDLALLKSGARNLKPVKALIDLEKIKVDDNGVFGLDEQITSIKESDDYLFQSETTGTKTKPQLINNGDPEGDGTGQASAFDTVMQKY